MARRKGEKEALRRERERREAEAKAAQRRKQLVGYGGGGLLAIAAIAAVVLLAAGGNGAEGQGGGSIFTEGGDVPEQTEFEIEAAAEAAGCELRSKRASGVLDHTSTLDEKVDYDTNPPTNGRHYQVPAEDGLYHEAPTDEQLVHTLEHGRVIVWVKPSLPGGGARERSARCSTRTSTRWCSCRGATCSPRWRRPLGTATRTRAARAAPSPARSGTTGWWTRSARSATSTARTGPSPFRRAASRPAASARLGRVRADAHPPPRSLRARDLASPQPRV